MFLDITKDKCPITFVKTKLALENLKKEEKLTLEIAGGEALDNLPNSLEELDFKIISKESIGNNKYRLLIAKSF